MDSNSMQFSDQGMSNTFRPESPPLIEANKKALNLNSSEDTISGKPSITDKVVPQYRCKLTFVVYRYFCTALRTELIREKTARLIAEAALEAEQKRRIQIERVLEDVGREQSSPFIVPALMDAFLKLAEMGDTAVLSCAKDGDGSTVTS